MTNWLNSDTWSLNQKGVQYTNNNLGLTANQKGVQASFNSNDAIFDAKLKPNGTAAVGAQYSISDLLKLDMEATTTGKFGAGLFGSIDSNTTLRATASYEDSVGNLLVELNGHGKKTNWAAFAGIDSTGQFEAGGRITF